MGLPRQVGSIRNSIAGFNSRFAPFTGPFLWGLSGVWRHPCDRQDQWYTTYAMVPCTIRYIAMHADGLSSLHQMEAKMVTITAHAPRETGFFGRIGAAVCDFLDAVAEARAMSERYEYLSRRSNSELAEMGLDRQRIAQAVARGF